MGDEEKDKDQGAERPEDAPQEQPPPREEPPEEQPTRVMRPARRRRLAGVFAALRERGGRLLSGVVAAALVVVPIALTTLFVIWLVGGGDDEREPALAKVQSADSSWLLGQSSLVAYPDYLAVADPANALGEERYTAYVELLAYIERQREKALREEQIREAIRLLQICEEARREYQAELAAAEREREREEQEAREARAKIKRKIQRLREKYAIEPGEECGIDEIAELFQCKTGFPIPKPDLPPLPPPPPAPPPPAPCELPAILEGVDLSRYT